MKSYFDEPFSIIICFCYAGGPPSIVVFTKRRISSVKMRERGMCR